MLQKAIYLLEDRLGSIIAISPVYKTAAWGFDSEDFLNCCVSIAVTMTPLKVLDTILEIENNLGRKRFEQEGYAPRTIDIDLLLYGTKIHLDECLQLPHPQMEKRAFVLSCSIYFRKWLSFRPSAVVLSKGIINIVVL